MSKELTKEQKTVINSVEGEKTIKQVDGETVVELDEAGREDMLKKMNDVSYDYIKRFIQLTLENKDKVSEDFYSFILKLNEFITKYNAPWYVPVYQAIKNGIVALVHINTNHEKYSCCYDCLLEKIGENLHWILDNFNPESEEYKTYPVRFSMAKIFRYAQEECNYPGNITEEYFEKIEKLKEEKAAQESQAMKMMVMISDIMEKAKKHKSNKKEYRFLFNRILLDANPNKYRLKLPKQVGLNDLLDIVRRLSKKYSIDEFVLKFKIPKEVIKVLELSDEELEQVHDEKIKKRLLNEVDELKKLAESVEKLTNGKLTIDELAKGIEDEEIQKILKESLGDLEKTEQDSNNKQQ